MKTKYLFISTIGCQMNVYDSQKTANILTPLGYKTTSSMNEADLIILNTCSIREKAEQKVFSFLGRLSSLKHNNPNLIIGVGGCVAQQEGKKILQRAPHIDLVFGTHAIPRLPGLIEQIEKNRYKVVDIDMSETIVETEPVTAHEDQGKPSSFVTIMQGCENFCSYCVVPYVRGSEISRKPDDIIKEIKFLVKQGTKEVTLLGQNVNSFGKKQKLCSFSDLLFMINEIDGLSRIRFTTSHPKDLSDDLVACFKNLPKLCSHIHLPVQSGSNRILKKMNRRYTKEHYLGKIDTLRKMCQDIAISSDIIVGFPGETDADFNDTLSLIKQVKYDGLFAFIYSDRPNAPASSFSEKVSQQDKKNRLQRILELQDTYTLQKNSALVGSTIQVLVEGLSKMQHRTSLTNSKKTLQWTGRSTTNKIVNFVNENKRINIHTNNLTENIFNGMLLDIKIEKAFSHSLWGNPVFNKNRSHRIKGEKSYAA